MYQKANKQKQTQTNKNLRNLQHKLLYFCCPSHLTCNVRLVLLILMGVVYLGKLNKVHLCKVAWWIMQLQWIPNAGMYLDQKSWNAMCRGGCTHQQQHPGVPDCARLSSSSSSSTLCLHHCLLDSKPQTFGFLPINFSRVIAIVKMLAHSSKLDRSAGQIGIYSGIHFHNY